MSIKILKKSFSEHRTIDSISVVTMYLMSWQDYYDGIGDLVDCNGDLITAGFTLPYEGDSFSIYYSTCYLTDCVLTDITMEPTLAPDVLEPVDNTGQDLDFLVNVTYTWSNDGANDTKRINEASSWKIRYSTVLDDVSVDTYIDVNNGDKIVWAEKYMLELDPNITIELPSGYTGLYSLGSDTDQKEYRDEVANTIPDIIKKTPRITATLTAFGSDVKAATYAKAVGKMNSVDFLGPVYSKKELALIEKNKLPGYDANDWLQQDDSNHWLFTDWTMEDTGNGFFEYELTFEYEDLQRDTPDGTWDRYFETAIPGFITLDMYDKIDFKAVLLSGMDAVLPNNREGCR